MSKLFELPEHWENDWKGMPEFTQTDIRPFKSITVHFRDEADVELFQELVGQNITQKTKYIYYPKQVNADLAAKDWYGAGNPRFPVFIPTKGRWKHRYTIKLFEQLGIPYTAVVEKQEYKKYAKVIDPSNILVLPHKNKGLTVTRNWIWDYAQKQGYEYFWTFDDNIQDIYRLNRNMKHRMTTGIALRIMEEFALRYENVYISGMQYEMFAPRKSKLPAFNKNTRVYSNMLIKTDIPYRNRLFYNDDTDLCLQILKDGHCTVLHYAFLIDKQTTMVQKGGMTDFYEQTDNRKEFVLELKKAHPDVVEITKKFGRWHHQVNYAPFKKNKLILKKGVKVLPENNEFGMKLKYKKK